MTNHWRDIRHADLIMINGANPAEAHPVGFQWMMRAKLDRGAKMIHADPRFTRTSAVSDKHLRIRTGTDVAYFGGLINYVLQNNLYHNEYVRVRDERGLRRQGGLRVQRRAVQRRTTRQKRRTTPADSGAYETRRPDGSPQSTSTTRARC